MSQTSTLTAERTGAEQTHFDVLIVGAGISGIGAAYHLSQQMSGKSYTILDVPRQHQWYQIDVVS